MEDRTILTVITSIHPPSFRDLWEQYPIRLIDGLHFSGACLCWNIKRFESKRAKASFPLNMLLPASVQEEGFSLPTWEVTGVGRIRIFNDCQRTNTLDSRGRKATFEVLSLISKILSTVRIPSSGWKNERNEKKILALE